MKCFNCPHYERLPFGDNTCYKLELDNFYPLDNCDMGLMEKARKTFKKRLIDDGFLHVDWWSISETDVGDEVMEYVYWMSDKENVMVRNERLLLGFSADGVEVECEAGTTWTVCMIPWKLIDSETIYKLRRLLGGLK